MTPVYEVVIKMTRQEEKFQKRDYLGIKETGNDDPYGPQRVEIEEVERTIVKIEVGSYLDVNMLVRAILEASKPPLLSTADAQSYVEVEPLP